MKTFKGINESGSPIEEDTLEEFKEAGGQPFIWNVDVSFNVEGYTQDEAWNKVHEYLSKTFTGQYESIEEPKRQKTLTRDDFDEHSQLIR